MAATKRGLSLASMARNLERPATKAEVNALITKITALNGTNRTTWQDRMQAEGALEREMNALDKRAAPGLHVGRTLRFRYADGYATYIVTAVNTRTVSVAHVALYDAWDEPFVRSAGYKVARKMAEQTIAQADRMAELLGARE
jgi:hypothetical protein